MGTLCVLMRFVKYKASVDRVPCHVKMWGLCGQMTGVSNGQWKLLLEARTHIAHFSPDSDLSDMGYIDIDARTVPPHSILDCTGRSCQLVRMWCFSFLT